MFVPDQRLEEVRDREDAVSQAQYLIPDNASPRDLDPALNQRPITQLVHIFPQIPREGEQ